MVDMLRVNMTAMCSLYCKKFIILVTFYMYMTAAYPVLNGIIAWPWYSSKFQEGAALIIITVINLRTLLLKSFKLSH